MKRFIVLFSMLSLFLAACGTLEISLETPPPELPAGSVLEETPEPRFSLTSSSEEIQRAMLESSTKWESVWMDGTVTQYVQDGSGLPSQISREQVWIDLSTSRFRILRGTAEGIAETFKASDGMTILELDLKTGQSQAYALSDSAKVKQFVPPLEPGTASPHPLWGQIGTPLSQLAFSSDFAQNVGTFKPVAMELVAGRETLVVEWTFAENELPSWRAWLDSETAVTLKMQNFGKRGGETVLSETVVSQVIYDESFDEALFRAPAALPQFSDITGGLNEPVEAVAGAPTGRDALGELYFFTSSRHTNEPHQLVRLPGLCVVGLAECPQLESVETPFTFDHVVDPLSWSPDGNFAAFIYPADENGTSYKLWLFDPAANTWTSLFESSSIDSPSWSPDGNWIAFRIQEDVRGSEVYAIRRDGSGLKNLTPLDSLPDDGLGLGYIMDGWINDNVIVRPGLLGGEGMIYSVRVPDGQIKPMFKASLAKGDLEPSHDGAWLAYGEHNQESNKLALFVRKLDGTDPLELASFSTDRTWLQFVWSPDNNHLAFVNTDFVPSNTSTSTDKRGLGNSSADVYVINRDGKGLKQVGRTLDADGGILFSPDGKFLLINEMTGPTGQRLFLVNLETLEQRIIQAPGLSLDGNWSLASWRK